MANLRVDKITSTETFETTGSVQFDGSSGTSLTVSNTASMIGTNDFTVEFFIYSNSTADRRVFSLGVNNADGSFVIMKDEDGIRVNWETITSTGGDLSVVGGGWHHVAAVRRSNNLKVYIDGKLDKDHGTVSVDFDANTLQIGDDSTLSNQELTAHISNLRVVQLALYTENFTPPTRELTVTPETVLLACQHKTDASHEKTGKTITVNGNAVASELTPGLLTDVVKSGGSSAITGSVEFDGNSDYLAITNSNEFDFDTSITIEAYVYFSDLTSSPVVFSRGGGNTSSSWNTTDGAQFAIYGTSTGRISFEYNSSGTPIQIISATGTLSVNSWNHIAVTYNGTTFTLYLNGINVGTASNAPTMPTTRSNIWIGMWPTSALVQDMKGFISNLRVVKGTALYTDNFIPPTRELKKVPGTVLLCCQDSNNPLTEATGKTIVGYGNLQNGPGVNFVKNGDFSDGTTNWISDSGANISATGGVATITNGGGDNLYAIRQDDILVIGKRYRFTGTIVPTFSSGTANFRVRAGGSAVSYATTALTNGETFNFDTGEVVADGANLEIGSGTSSDMTQFTLTNVYGETLDSTEASNFTPQVGNDGSVEFVGPTKINTENYFYLPTGDTESRYLNVATQASSSARGLFGHGINPSANVNTIEFITIASTGDAIDFGDLNNALRLSGSCSSSTRGLWGGGFPSTNVIDYVTISSKGDAQDFGDLTAARLGLAGCSNSTRGLFAGGRTVNTIDYVTIASTGDAKDFGDLTVARSDFEGVGCASPTRGVWSGGYTPTLLNTIDYVTIATTGNATDFGDTRVPRSIGTSCSNSTRGLIVGGAIPAPPTTALTNSIDYITISTTGNSLEFGELTNPVQAFSGCSSTIRGVFAGGQVPGLSSTIQYVNIASTGDAVEFGNLTESKRSLTACSSGHGGLG